MPADWVSVVTGTAMPLGEGLARGLEEAGGTVVRHHGLLSGREEADAVFADAAGRGRLRLAVHAAVAPEAVRPVRVADLDDERWHAVWEATMRSTIAFLRAAFSRCRGGGSVWVVIPTVAMSGAAGFVPAAAAAEGQRLLVRSAARQWGGAGVRANCLAVAPETVFSGGVRADDLALAPAAFGRPPEPATELAPLVAALAGEAGRFVTGLTLCVDGGAWMSG